MGSDYIMDQDQQDLKTVSTHAPAWGATLLSNNKGTGFKFQPTLPHGERQSIVVSNYHNLQFQPTLPHGERQAAGINPQQLNVVSTHAPAWGATT